MRWYSGRTAREAPDEAARLMWVQAVAKLEAGSRGYCWRVRGWVVVRLG